MLQQCGQVGQLLLQARNVVLDLLQLRGSTALVFRGGILGTPDGCASTSVDSNLANGHALSFLFALLAQLRICTAEDRQV